MDSLPANTIITFVSIFNCYVGDYCFFKVKQLNEQIVWKADILKTVLDRHAVTITLDRTL